MLGVDGEKVIKQERDIVNIPHFPPPEIRFMACIVIRRERSREGGGEGHVSPSGELTFLPHPRQWLVLLFKSRNRQDT